MKLENGKIKYFWVNEKPYQKMKSKFSGFLDFIPVKIRNHCENLTDC